MEIDRKYTAHPKYKKIQGLPFTIEQAPEQFSKEEVPPRTDKSIFTHFDDEKIIMLHPTGKGGSLYLSNIYWFGSAGMFLFMFVVSRMMDFDFEPPSLMASIFAAMIPAIFAVYYRVKVRKYPELDCITFYRHLGFIELPKDDKGTGSFVIHFKDLKASIINIITPNHYSGPQLRFFREYSKGFNLFVHFEWISMSWSNNPMEYWSFYVWYMDRNRPLPPGTAFDPYRKKDYERRKAEGFPPPLYESKIPTPEWVPGSDASTLDNLN